MSSLSSSPSSKYCVARLVCRVCDHAALLPILDLHDQPLANAYLPHPTRPLSWEQATDDTEFVVAQSRDQTQQQQPQGQGQTGAAGADAGVASGGPAASGSASSASASSSSSSSSSSLPPLLTFPLQLNLCPECFHLQLSHVVNPEILYSYYLYVSGTNETIDRYFQQLARRIDSEIPPVEGRPRRILEIACNDATQLDHFHTLGWKTFGVDPAENIVSLQRHKPHTLICDFWGEECARRSFPQQTFDVLLAQNVFAHVDDVHGFLAACKQVMHAGSKLYIQTSQCEMVQRNEFDTIYHEHLSFFCVKSMQTCAARHGLYLNDVHIQDIHGNSFLFVLELVDRPGNVTAALAKEASQGLHTIATYHTYAERCTQVVRELKQALERMREQGYKVIGYGAAAKGMTLLHFGNIDSQTIPYVVDDAKLKQGLYTPGTNIPIKSLAALIQEAHPKLLVLPLAWNFFTEIQNKVQRLLVGQGKQITFVRYFPDVELIEERKTLLGDASASTDGRVAAAAADVPAATLAPKASMRSATIFPGCEIRRRHFQDARGSVVRIVADAPDSEASASPADEPRVLFEQLLIVRNGAHVLRGLAYSPYAKEVIINEGAIYHVLVDLRVGSPTYKQWYGFEMSAADPNSSSVLVPPHFAHGYYSPEPSSLLMAIAAPAAAQARAEVRFTVFDHQLQIEWPFDAATRKDRLQMNAADRLSKSLQEVEGRIRAQQTMRILIFGAQGFVGQQLVAYLRTQPNYVIHESDAVDIPAGADDVHVVLSHLHVDPANGAAVTAQLDRLGATHVVSCIGMVRGPKAATEAAAANIAYLQHDTAGIWAANHAANLRAPRFLAALALERQLHFTYFGTAGFFDASAPCVSGAQQSRGFVEEDAPNFFGSNYALVKAEADQTMQDLMTAQGESTRAGSILNLRLAHAMGADRQTGVLGKVLSYSALHGPLQAQTISCLPTLFPALERMWQARVGGTFHFANPGQVTWMEIIQAAQASDATIPVPPVTEAPANQSAGSSSGMRPIPPNVLRLDTAKLQSFYPQLPSIQAAMAQVIPSAIRHKSA